MQSQIKSQELSDEALEALLEYINWQFQLGGTFKLDDAKKLGLYVENLSIQQKLRLAESMPFLNFNDVQRLFGQDAKNLTDQQNQQSWHLDLFDRRCYLSSRW